MTDRTISSSKHTARRPHKRPCFWCRLPILKGDRYVRTTTSYDGRLFSACAHVECEQELVDSGAFKYDEMLPEGYLVEDLGDTTPEWYEWYTARLEADINRTQLELNKRGKGDEQ